MKEVFKLENDLLFIEDWMNNDESLVAGSTTRNGGVSTNDYTSFNMAYHVGDEFENVKNNRVILGQKLDFPLEQWVLGHNTHTTNIKKVTNEDLGKGVYSWEDGISNTDGLYTNEKGILLGCFNADCTPIWLYAPKHELVGVIHAGWKGTVNEILLKFINVWKNDELVNPEDIYVVIGPAISLENYEVGYEVVKDIPNMEAHGSEHGYYDLGNGKYKFDSKYLNFIQAIYAGVPHDNIKVSAYCSCADKDTFFSYRRDKEKTGRMLSFIGYKK